MELININNVTEWCANGLLQLLRELRTLTSVINTTHTQWTDDVDTHCKQKSSSRPNETQTKANFLPIFLRGNFQKI